MSFATFPGFGLRFHHLGLAVREPAKATNFLVALGYRIGERVFDPHQNVNLIMCDHDAMPAVEIICPGDTPGPVDKLTDKHRDGLVYHMCFETDSLASTLAAIKEKSAFWMVCAQPPKPAVLFGGKPVSFYVVSGVGLIEIIDNAAAG